MPNLCHLEVKKIRIEQLETGRWLASYLHPYHGVWYDVIREDLNEALKYIKINFVPIVDNLNEIKDTQT